MTKALKLKLQRSIYLALMHPDVQQIVAAYFIHVQIMFQIQINQITLLLQQNITSDIQIKCSPQGQ